MADDREGSVGRRGAWQGAAAGVVLRCVFAHVGAHELWRCGAVCRAWRDASLDDALWRRLLLPGAAPQLVRSLRRTVNSLYENEDAPLCRWREEYCRSAARWRRSRLPSSDAHSAPLLCASLHSSGLYLALLDEDAHLTIWENANENADADNLKNNSTWLARWSGPARASWGGAGQAQWAPSCRRLLLAGRPALTDSTELLVLQFSENWSKTTVCRSGSGSRGGCWVDDDSFLALHLQVVAPGLACTTVWLTAASQETQSEHAGVTTPLMRIYNEASAHVTHVATTEVPTADSARSERELNVEGDRVTEPTASYYRALRPKRDKTERLSRLLVASCGAAGGARGEARAVAAWVLPRTRGLPRVHVADGLSERVRAREQARRQRAALPPGPDEPPDERTVRALCTPPTAVCDLFAQIFGFTFHPRGGCMWATTAAGAACLSLPGLFPLLHVPRDSTRLEFSLPPHYVLPTADDDYFVSPDGCGSPLVSLWSVMSARRCPLSPTSHQPWPPCCCHPSTPPALSSSSPAKLSMCGKLYSTEACAVKNILPLINN